MSRFTLTILLLIAAPTAAQISDTTAAWRYYPLGVGDWWEYEVCSCQIETCDPCTYLRQRVTDFTTIQGKAYAERRSMVYTLQGQPLAGPWVELIRFDTLAARPFYRTGQFYPERAYFPCRLDEPFPDDPQQGRPLDCGEDTTEETMRGGADEPFMVGPSSYTGALKEYSFAAGHHHTTTFVAGIGRTFYRWDGSYVRTETLVHARVGGVVYGAASVAADPNPDHSQAELNIYPNPSGKAATATLVLGRPGHVRVVLLDVLGREVALLHDGLLRGGEHRIPLNVTTVPPGVYIVRGSAGDGAATARWVITR